MSIDRIKTIALGRRELLKNFGLSAVAVASSGLALKNAQATPAKAAEYLSKMTNGSKGT